MTRAALALALALGACAAPPAEPTAAEPRTVSATTADGVTLVGEVYDGALPASAPVAVLFHQGGSSGRGEYGPLVGWLHGHGVRAVAWDLRSGGDTHGVPNRTAADLAEGTPAEFCDAGPDLAAALDWALSESRTERVVVVGSSYSAALAIRLAADRPEAVAGVVAFSPASGGPMAACRARDRVDAVTAPVLVLRPASEMALESAQEQRAVLEAAGAEVVVVEEGVHGASMLIDERTGHDMAGARAVVGAWIERVVG